MYRSIAARRVSQRLIGQHHARRPSNLASKGWMQRRSASGNSKGKAPPHPPLPSPSAAKRQYLESHEKTIDPLQKMAQLNRELEQVREEATAKLDKELNKSIYRKLTDPLRRHQHSVINVGVATLSYILAHSLFVKSKEAKRIQAELEASQQENAELQQVLLSLLRADTIQSMATACVEEVQEDHLPPQASKSSWGWFSDRSKIRGEGMEERFADALRTELEKRIGDYALDDEEKKQRDIQKVWQESQKEVEALSEDPERLLLALEQEQTTTTDGSRSDAKQRRVFSM